MRIALVSQEYPPETSKGGIGAQTILKAHGLAARGHKVHVISRSPDKNRTERMDGSVHVIRIPGFESWMPVYTEIADWLTYSTEVSAAINDLHSRHPIDLVEFPEWACEGYVYLTNRTEWNYIPTVIQLHGPLVMFANTMGWPDKQSEFYRIGTEMERTCLRNADAVFSSSLCSADWCARSYGLDLKSIPVLHTGVNTELFSPQPVPREKNLTIIFVGKLVRNKGTVLLVEAACRLAREIPNLRLKLIGRSDELIVREIVKLAETASCPDLLEIMGPVPREKLPEQLSRAHVFAAPSQFEGGPGFVYLEAMACGLPVIACSGSGVSEVVTEGQNGLLVPPNDNEALYGALKKLLSNSSQREKMGNYARTYVLNQADSRKCMDNIEAYYQAVVNRKPGVTS